MGTKAGKCPLCIFDFVFYLQYTITVNAKTRVAKTRETGNDRTEEVLHGAAEHSIQGSL
jgi:hypothetical protein